MRQNYDNLSDEEKLALAIEYRVYNTPMPTSIVQFLKAEGLYDLIMNPLKDEP